MKKPNKAMVTIHKNVSRPNPRVNPRHRRRIHYTRRRLGVYTIAQLFDYLSDYEEADLDKLRTRIKALVEDDLIWTILKDARNIDETRKATGEALERRINLISKGKVKK